MAPPRNRRGLTPARRWAFLAASAAVAAALLGWLAWRAAGRAPASGPRQGPAVAGRLREQGETALERGDLTAALRLADRCIRAAPVDVSGYLLRASVRERSGQLEAAARDLGTAHRLAPARADIALRLLRILPPSEGYAEMEPVARAAIASAPDSPEAHLHLAVALAHNADPARWVEAVPAFEAAARLNPYDARALIELGKLEARLGRDAAAARHLEEAQRRLARPEVRLLTRMRPFDLRAQQRTVAFWLKQVYQRQRSPRQAAVARELDRLNGRWQEEKELRQRGLAVPPDWEAKRRLAALVLADGDRPLALTLAREILAAFPGDPAAARIAAVARRPP